MAKFKQKPERKNGKKKDKKDRKPFLSRQKMKEILQEKRARLVVKNLPFKTTEEDLRKHFSEFGEISSINLLKKPDGKLVGCAFIQYLMVQFAKKAKHHTDNQLFMGRNISVDFAKSKEKYTKEKEEVVKIKQEDIKEEPIDDVAIKMEEEEEEEDEAKEESDADSGEFEDGNKEETSSQISESTSRKQPFESHDVSEGKTIFIKNVPFDATNADLRECMYQFGPTYYSLICVDKLTEHSKGTAFVKFVNKEDAGKALSAGTELTLKGNILDCHPAIDRTELKNKENQLKEQKSQPKDSRNLYLVKEGVILAGTKAAEGVSATDMAKRLQIEQYKTQMLRNLNTFVARDRLVVHNLPATWDDRKLKMLFQKHGGTGALVREARVMRDMRTLNGQGVGESKQFGFVAFTRHEHALAALRSLNNNPNVFSASRRPIVCFSIESKTALKAKVRRQEKSRLKNPKSKDYDHHHLEESKREGSEDVEAYAGITSREGAVHKMRSRYKLTQQAKLHHENLKKEKKKQKMAKKSLSERRKDFIKQPKQKVNRRNVEDSFSRMVSDYKQKIGNALTKKGKWYQQEG